MAENKGRIFVTGIGPGDEKYMTGQALEALEQADLIVGYTVYINLLPERFRSKDTYATGMGGEKERCSHAVDCALSGRKVAVVCSGDPGVYGMASLILQMAPPDEVDITIIPGVTAALSGASLLGSPIGTDHALISLSTALTPWDIISSRLEHAARGDFALVLYNPMSRTRPDTLRMACDIIAGQTGWDRAAGYARNIGREGREAAVCSLKDLRDMELDMFTTVFIGSSATEIKDGKMITGRKY